MKNIIVILDPAHGANVAGKCSPDKTHREYLWSRARVRNIKKLLIANGYEVHQTTTSENEPGLSYRKNVANSICKGKRKLLLSFHNDAKGRGDWNDARGCSVWTTKGITKSDRCAQLIIARLEKDFPEVRMRRYMKTDLNEDREENFTVLMGSDYMACLIEWLFQDNKEDVKMLQSEEYNTRFEASIVRAIEDINNYFGK